MELYFIHLLVFTFIGSKLISNHLTILPERNYLWIAAILVSIILSIISNSILSHLAVLFLNQLNDKNLFGQWNRTNFPKN